MVGRNRSVDVSDRYAVRRPGDVFNARGGVSPGAVFTGVVVAFGAMFLLSAVVGGVLVAGGFVPDDIVSGDTVEVGIGAGVALLIAQFLSYMWGGYTAGRMARGAGATNGFLVPLVALVVAVVIAAIAGVLGATANLNLPFTENRLPLEENYLVEWGTGIGIVTLVAMFLGGIVGGAAGARWHRRLEDRTLEEHDETVDVRERDYATTGQTPTKPTDRT